MTFDVDTYLADLERRVAAADWRDIPTGRYAIEVHDDYLDMDDPDFCRLLGWRIYERKTPRTYRNGRTVGKGRFTSSLLTAQGIDPRRLATRIAEDSVDPQYDLRRAVVDILDDIADGDYYRATFGQATGRCGTCGKTLTDPDSKAAGIGPDCRRTTTPAAEVPADA